MLLKLDIYILMSPLSKINIIGIFLYSSLLIGLYFGEDSLGGAFRDYQSHSHISEKFRNDFMGTLLNYDQLGHRHSPLFYMFKSILIKNEIVMRLFFLHIYMLIPLFFYKSLKLLFNLKYKNYIKLLSFVLFLFPTIRSYSIWPDPHLLGTVFFSISIFYFLKYKFAKKNNFKYCVLNTFFLALSAYCSPNFGIFIIFYFLDFFNHFKLGKKILFIGFFNILLSIPFFYYLFIMDINFIFNKSGWDIGNNIFSINNLSNKFTIVNSLFFFYLTPLLFCKSFRNNIILISYKNITNWIFLLILFVFFSYNFEFKTAYNLTNSGGGFFYNFSQVLFNNNIILFLASFLGLVILTSSFLHSNLNIILYSVTILSNPQLTLWQANYSPTLFLIIFLLLDFKYKVNIGSIRTMKFIYLYFFIYLLGNIVLKSGLNINKMLF